MAERQRNILRTAGRGALVGLTVVVGMIGVRLLTAVPGYGASKRGAIALQGFSRLLLPALGIRVQGRGLQRSGPSLVVANRVCWLDVLVLAAAGPIVPLIDDAVLRWKLIGPMVSRVGAVWVRPGVSRDLSAAVRQVTAGLRRGHRVLVFPHVHGPGCAAERFSRAAFQAAVDAAVVISPVAISYSRSPVAPTDVADLPGSLWQFLRAGPITACVAWLPVIPAVAGPGHRAGHRDAAARRTEWAIDRALGRTVATRTAKLPADVPVLALAS